ncbi:MAG TPA: hypothetical protein VGP18_06005 [Solirubrobacteraceae bacterium]|jgi:hypothetical protein|nr:hypothetical protein [Solirubrobacteraceae bacterium]
MAHVVAFIPDLLFGSRVQAALLADGQTVELTGDPEAVAGALTDASVLVVDLTDADYGGVSLVEALSAQESLAGVRTLGFYSHVDVEMRAGAEQASFDMVVPRSRMAREGPALVAKLVRDEDHQREP